MSNRLSTSINQILFRNDTFVLRKSISNESPFSIGDILHISKEFRTK